MKFKLSKKDSKNLFLFLSVVIISCTFFFIYFPSLKRAEEIEESNSVLSKRLEQLSLLEVNLSSVEEEKELYQIKSKELLANFPELVRTEKIIAILVDMEEKTEVDINSASFEMNQLFYTDPSTQSIGAEYSAKTMSGETDGAVMDTMEVSSYALEGYRSRAVFTYKSTYEALKKVISYINEYPDKMSIVNMSSSFDSSTGNLSGNFTVYFYHIPGLGHPYEPPVINDISIGTDNIFSSFEIKYKPARKNSR